MSDFLSDLGCDLVFKVWVHLADPARGKIYYVASIVGFLDCMMFYWGN